jgi:hypothetical protein
MGVADQGGGGMASVAAGSKLRVQGSRSTLVLRSLRAVELDGGWCVPVLGDVAALLSAGITTRVAIVEFPTESGFVRLDAELVRNDDAFVLRAPGLRTAAIVEQRRENVRGLIRLPLRGTVLATASTRAEVGSEEDDEPAGPDLAGTTESVSAGGFSADLERAPWVSAGSKIYVELGMPGGDLAPAVLSVIERDGTRVRARFIDISPRDRERLVRMVFARQRAELAERRQADDR